MEQDNEEVTLDDVRAALESGDLEQAHLCSLDLYRADVEREALLSLWLEPQWPLGEALRIERALLWSELRDDLAGVIALATEGIEGGDARALALTELWERFDGEDTQRALDILDAARGLASSEALRLELGGWLAGPLMARGEHERAVELLEAALSSPSADEGDAVVMRIDLATAHVMRGDLASAAFVLPSEQDALILEEHALRLARDTTEALIWQRRGAPTRAIALLEPKIALLDLEDESLITYDFMFYTRAIYLLFTVYSELGDQEEALKLCVLNLDCAERCGHTIEIARALLALGMVYIMCASYEDAHETLSAALSLADEAGELNMVTIVRFMMCWAKLWAAEEDGALTHEHFDALEWTTGPQRAIMLAVRGDMLEEPETLREAAELCRRVGAARMEADALADLARLVEPSESVTLLKRALHLLIALASALDDEAQRLDVLASARLTGFRLALDQLELGLMQGALATIHEVKAADFMRMLARQRGDSPELGALATAQVRIPSQAMHLWDQPTVQTGRLLEGYLGLVRESAHTIPALVSSSRIFANLAEDHAIIEYLWPSPGFDTCIIATMCRGELKLATIELQEGLPAQLERVIELIRGERGEGSRVLAARLASGLRAVHEALVSPVLAMLPEGVDKLTICPGEHLVDAPFEALLDEESRPLAARYTLTFAVSSAQLAVRSVVKTALRVAVLWRPDDALEYADSEDRWLGERLAREGVSVRRVASWSRDVARGAELIHYAGHAGFMGEADGEGGLEVASFEGERFVARPLVVLSACETGRVQAHGEELVGFLRAVFGAGASALVCAGWRVHDAATEALMQSFYEALLGGLPAPEALRCATQTLHTRQDAWRHPFFWACWRCWIGAAPSEAP
jgi:tetratricopeptide (TPR) repeat protein